MTLGYLDWALRAFAIGFGAWIAVGALSRFDHLAEQRQAQVSVAPSPSPSPEVSPSPVATPTLSPLAIEVSSWDFDTRFKWIDFCEQTRNGLGYGAKEQGICRALSEVRQ